MGFGSSNVIIDAGIVIVIVVVAVIVLLIFARPCQKKRQVLSLAQVQDGLHRTGIVAIEGKEPGPGLCLYVRNRGGALLQLQSEQGTVIEATDPQRQNMISPRPQALEIPPKTTQRFEMEALSLEAHRLPPGTRGEGGYRVGGLTENDEILNLFGAVDRLQAEAARHVRQVDGDLVTYRHMVDDLTILATCCSCAEKESGGYEVRVSAEVIQYALWQITDKLSFDALVDLVVQPASPEGRVKLVGKVLAANILLAEAGIEPTAEI